MTLADEDTNSILTDNANRAIQGNWQCSDATWWPTLQTMQMVPPDDQISNIARGTADPEIGFVTQIILIRWRHLPLWYWVSIFISQSHIS